MCDRPCCCPPCLWNCAGDCCITACLSAESCLFGCPACCCGPTFCRVLYDLLGLLDINLFGGQVDFNSGSLRSTTDDTMTISHVDLNKSNLDDLLSLAGFRWTTKRAVIQRMELNKFDFAELVHENSDLELVADGLFIVFECDGPLFYPKSPQQPSSSSSKASPHATAKARRNHKANSVFGGLMKLFDTAENIESIFSVLSTVTGIKASRINICIESKNSQGGIDTVGIVWRQNVIAYENLSQLKRKQYGVDQLDSSQYAKTIEKELITDIPTVYLKKNTSAVQTSGSCQAFGEAMMAAVPTQNGENGEYLIVDSMSGLRDAIGMALRYCQKGSRAMCCGCQIPSCLAWMCCICGDATQPNVVDTQLLGVEVSLSDFMINCTDQILPLLKGSPSLYSLFDALGNTGVNIDDKYTMEYLLYTAFFTTVDKVGGIVAQKQFPWKGRGTTTRDGKITQWLGPPGQSWVHTLTPADAVTGQGQPVDYFCFNAPNKAPGTLVPSLVIDMGYRSNDTEFPETEASKFKYK